jgi:aspartyl-tRNA(Asn)/glutamyl-tRNA(Gln) amidotransferase subunit C
MRAANSEGVLTITRVAVRALQRVAPVGSKAPVPPQEIDPQGPRMSVDKDTVRRVARLARIAFPEERLEPMAKELNAILAWVEQLNEVDTSKVEPMTSVVKMSLTMRDDVVTDGDRAGAVVQNAPLGEDNYFAVPKVVE